MLPLKRLFYNSRSQPLRDITCHHIQLIEYACKQLENMHKKLAEPLEGVYRTQLGTCRGQMSMVPRVNL
jgi:hypothetical protein